jgi:hypothetical protein
MLVLPPAALGVVEALSSDQELDAVVGVDVWASSGAFVHVVVAVTPDLIAL